MNKTETEHWFPFFKPNRRARLRMFCFPYAGAGASVFRSWTSQLPDHIELCGVQYPGRENRSAETPFKSITQLVERLLPAIVPLLDKPFLFFGHSMGSLVSFELTRALTASYGLRPEHTFFSAAGAPHIPEPRPVHHLPGGQFLLELVKLNGIPAKILKSLDVLAYMLPILRADFTACETYNYQIGEPLQCPVTVFGGFDDPRVDRQRLDAWRHHAGVAFSQRMFRGDHFYLRSAQTDLLRTLAHELGEVNETLSVA